MPTGSTDVGCEALISLDTYLFLQQLGEHADLPDVGCLRVKGRNEPIPAYRLDPEPARSTSPFDASSSNARAAS